MRLVGSVLVLLLIGSAALAIDTGPAFDDPAMQKRYENVIAQVRCLTCQNQTIKDSNSLLAAELRREIRDQIGDGKTDAEIYDFLTARYTEFALYKPPFNARNLILWVAPPGFLLIAALVVVRVLRKRSQLTLDDEPERDS